MSFDSDTIGIGQSIFHNIEGQSFNVRHINISNSPYSVDETDNVIFADASGGQIVINFLRGDFYPHQAFTVKKTDSSPNYVTIIPVDSGVTVSLAAQYNIDQPDETAQFIYDSNNLNWELLTQDLVSSSVNGPPSSTNNAIVRFNGTSGALLKDSSSLIDDAGLLTTAAVATDNIKSKTGNDINVNFNDSTNKNFNLYFYPSDSAPSLSARGFRVVDATDTNFGTLIGTASYPGTTNSTGCMHFNYGRDGNPSDVVRNITVWASDTDEASSYPIHSEFIGIASTGRAILDNANIVLSGSVTQARDLYELRHFNTVIHSIDRYGTHHFFNLTTQNGFKFDNGKTLSPGNNTVWMNTSGNLLWTDGGATVHTVTVDDNPQVLTNKTITGATNIVEARSLTHAAGAIDVSASAAPLARQVLTANSATTGSWKYPIDVVNLSLPANQPIGTQYVGGYYVQGSLPNDFTTPVLLGDINVGHGGFVFLVQGGAVITATVTITISGTSWNEHTNTRTAADVENLSFGVGSPINTYRQTEKKWIGQVTISHTPGDDIINCNYGFVNYIDRDGVNPFILNSISTDILAGANDYSWNMQIIHHKPTGWTYNAGGPATHPAPIHDMNVDYNPESNLVIGDSFSWVKKNLNNVIAPYLKEGLLIKIITTSVNSISRGNIQLGFN